MVMVKYEEYEGQGGGRGCHEFVDGIELRREYKDRWKKSG